jgi:FK506-binding protein 2
MDTLTTDAITVFETELLGIAGVEKPEKIVTKASEAAEEASEAASQAAEKVEQNVAEKVASVVEEAAGAAKTFIADTDDMQGHEEL